MARAEDFARAKRLVGTDPYATSWFRHISRHTEPLMEEPLVGDDVPASLGDARAAVGRIWRLAFMYHWTGDARFADRAWEGMAALAALDHWEPDHFLNVGEITAGMAVGYDWCFDHWSTTQRETIRDAIVDHGLEPGLEITADHRWWASAEHNWNTVCNGGLAMGALALAGDPAVHETVTRTIASTRDSIRLPVRNIGRMGGWEEGPVYWGYMARYLVFYLASTLNTLGHTHGLLRDPGIAVTGYFPIYTQGPDGTYNYADSSPTTINAPQLFWLAHQFDDHHLASRQREVLGRGNPIGEPYRDRTGVTGGANDWGICSLLWYRPNLCERSAELPYDRVFPDVNVGTMRTSWDHARATFLGFKGGNNQAPHCDLDLGSFVFDALGTRWAEELGGDSYGLDGYFDFAEQRWQYYRKRAEGQNTIVINPDAGPDQEIHATAEITRYDASIDASYGIVDISEAYTDHTTAATRGFALWDDRRCGLIRDELETEAPVDLYWFMHTEANVEIGDGVASLTRNGEQLTVYPVESDARLEVTGASPLPTSPNPSGQAANEGVKKVVIMLEAVTDPALTVVLEPIVDERRQPQPSTIPELEHWTVPSLEALASR